jgi:hypothetical protein
MEVLYISLFLQDVSTLPVVQPLFSKIEILRSLFVFRGGETHAAAPFGNHHPDDPANNRSRTDQIARFYLSIYIMDIINR